MKHLFRNIFYAFPVQLFILHFRKYQVLLFFWLLLFSTINSGFMKIFGADALFFSPEYLGSVNIFGTIITGMALGVYMMSWNITTFILHSRRFKFLATTSNPFLKYCINNAILPLLFLCFYFGKMYMFNTERELMPVSAILAEMAGILLGITITLVIAFGYFFGAGKTITRTMAPIVSNPELFKKTFNGRELSHDEFGLRVWSYFNATFKLRKVRNVGHYRQDFIDAVFKRHHLAAIASIVLAFFFLAGVGFFLDNKYFEMPAAASILVFFALMVALIGSLAYFLQSWSLPFAIVLFLFINFLFQQGVIDPRNKAYGLDYANKDLRPSYTKKALVNMCDSAAVAQDRSNMLSILEKWKAKQPDEKPLMVFINVSGGGLRSAAFVMNTLQQLDSSSHGQLMNRCFLISGASGGMLSAAYYRELYRKRLADPAVNLHDPKFTEAIAGDLLNPVFTSLMARDLLAPAQKFQVGGRSYVKDRGYAFEKKLTDNTAGLLGVPFSDLQADESAARIPLIIFNAVIKSDGRKMMISTQPLRFMMKPARVAADTSVSPDAVDFKSLFAAQDPGAMRLSTALRMNATFPYVLPNVWLPSKPVIDVMDAGLRDNYGQETTLRFIDNFRDWIKANTGGVLIIQIRDRMNDNWQQPFETKSVGDMLLTPATMLQHNWYKLQDFFQGDQFAYLQSSMDSNLNKVTIMYMPEKEDKGAALNFHLTGREKRDVFNSFSSAGNAAALKRIAALLGH